MYESLPHMDDYEDVSLMKNCTDSPEEQEKVSRGIKEVTWQQVQEHDSSSGRLFHQTAMTALGDTLVRFTRIVLVWMHRRRGRQGTRVQEMCLCRATRSCEV